MRINRKNRTPVAKNEQGIAAILVVMVLMTLLALISIGFSRLMNREGRQALDRQLSLAAFYAAESGSNDARYYIEASGGSFNGCSTPTTGSNSGPAQRNFVPNGDISGDGLFKYSCVTVNTTPSELQFTIKPGESKVVHLTNPSFANHSSLYFGWQNAAPYHGPPQPLDPSTTPAYGVLPQQSSIVQDNTGLLRVSVYPAVPNGSCNDTDSTHGNRYTFYKNATASGGASNDTADATLECAARTYFMDPSPAIFKTDTPDCTLTLLNAKGCVRYDKPNDDGALVPGNCSIPVKVPNTSFSAQATGAYCNTVISNLVPVNNGASPDYTLRLTAVYQAIRVFVQAGDVAIPTSSTPAANSLAISNAEAVIDVTGTGNDILRRIQAIAPLKNNLQPFNYGLQSIESVCKLFRVPVTAPGTYGQAYLDNGVSSLNLNTDNTCFAPTGSNAVDPNGLPPIDISPPAPTPGSFSGGFDRKTGGSGSSISLTWNWPGISGGSPPDSVTGCQIEGLQGGPLGVGPGGSATFTLATPGGSTDMRCFSTNGGSVVINQS